jgi:hypothetical protein
MQGKPGAQSLLSVQGPVLLLPLALHKPPAQAFPQLSKQLLLQVVTTQGTGPPEETLPVEVVPELAVVLPLAASVTSPAPEPLLAAVPEPAGGPPLLVVALVPLARPPQPTARTAAIIETRRAGRSIGAVFAQQEQGLS